MTNQDLTAYGQNIANGCEPVAAEECGATREGDCEFCVEAREGITARLIATESSAVSE